MYILFDIGGTKTRIAASQSLEHFSDPIIMETPEDYAEGIRAITAHIKKLAEDKKIHAVCGGIAGPLDPQNKKLRNAPNLSDWNNKPLRHELSDTLDAPVYIENDAAMVGLGEVHYGAGKQFADKGIVAYITVSTGVGGSRIVNGSIDASALGFEPGHQIIDADGSMCPDCACTQCSHTGHIEAYISGSSIQRRFNKEAYTIEEKDFWDKEAKWLAYALNNIVVLWSPHLIVLGGSMMKEVGIDVSATEKYLREIVTIFPTLPAIQKATLKDVGGLYGAMVYLQQIHN